MLHLLLKQIEALQNLDSSPNLGATSVEALGTLAMIAPPLILMLPLALLDDEDFSTTAVESEVAEW